MIGVSIEGMINSFSENLIPYPIKLETNIEIGTTSLGKYTLPNISALLEKVLDVFR